VAAGLLAVVAVGGEAVGAGKGVGLLGPEHGLELVAGPHVEAPFLAAAVGVEAGIEAAGGRGHVREHEVEECRRPTWGIAGLGERGAGFGIQRRQLRVVVEHLLEVRQEPVGSTA
jgi:hypothetical protein